MALNLSRTLKIEDGLTMNTLETLLNHTSWENEHIQTQIAELNEEADRSRKQLVKMNRQDSSSTFEHTDISIRIDDLEFRVKAVNRRVSSLDNEAQQMESKISSSSQHVEALKLRLATMEEQLESLQRIASELHNREINHQLKLKNLTLSSGDAAHARHMQLKQILYELKICDDARRKIEREHAAIARRAQDDAKAHREHAESIMFKIRQNRKNITAKERDMEDILTDNIQNEKTLREILNIEERLQRQCKSTSKNVDLLYESKSKAEQAQNSLKNQLQALNLAKHRLETSNTQATHNLALSTGRLRVLTEAMNDVKVQQARKGIMSPYRQSLKYLDNVQPKSNNNKKRVKQNGGESAHWAIHEEDDSFGILQTQKLQLDAEASKKLDDFTSQATNYQRQLRKLEDTILVTKQEHRVKLAEVGMSQRRLQASEATVQKLQHVVDDLGIRRDDLNQTIVNMLTEAREFVRNAQDEIEKDSGCHEGLMEQLSSLVVLRKDKETQLAALDRHRHLSTIGSKLTAENRSNPTVTLTMLKDFSLNGQGADSIVVIGGEQELLLQYGHDMRREHQITVQDAQQRVNQLVYDIHLAHIQHEELKRQESNAQCQVDKLNQSLAKKKSSVIALTSDTLATRAHLSKKLLASVGEIEGTSATQEKLSYQGTQLAARCCKKETSIAAAKRQLANVKLDRNHLIAQIQSQISVEMLREETHSSLKLRLKHHGEQLYSFTSQIKKLTFDVNVLHTRQLQMQSAGARNEMALQLAVDELQRLQITAVELKEYLQSITGASAVSRSHIYNSVFRLNRELTLLHHRLKRLMVAMEVSLEEETSLKSKHKNDMRKRDADLVKLQQRQRLAIKRSQELEYQLAKRHAEMHSVVQLEQSLAEHVKDGELDTEEAQNTCQQQELALSTRKHILNAKHEEQKALATHCEDRKLAIANKKLLTDRLIEHEKMVDEVTTSLRKDRDELQQSVDALRVKLQDRETKHAELLQTLCNVRLEIGRSADVSSESADICAHIESSREAYRHLTEIVVKILRSNNTQKSDVKEVPIADQN